VYVTASRLAESIKTSYPTARAAIDTLVALGILAPYGCVRGAQVWEAQERLRNVYES
jgi:coenzyme F420-reducing hydrogenase gamma subunit